MTRRTVEVVSENDARREERGAGKDDGGTERLVALGRALSDPIRVEMLRMLAEGRACCDLPDLGAPVGEQDTGICVCEFQDLFGMGQSKVSYHVRKLKQAGLVKEEKRGKWSFYSLDGEAAAGLLDGAAALLLPSEGGRNRDDGCS